MAKSLTEELERLKAVEGSGITRRTVNKAKTYIPIAKHLLLTKIGFEADDPEVNLGQRGSIDCSWKSDKYDVVLTVPARGTPFYTGRILGTMTGGQITR